MLNEARGEYKKDMLKIQQKLEGVGQRIVKYCWFVWFTQLFHEIGTKENIFVSKNVDKGPQ